MASYRLTNKAETDLSSLYEYGLLNFGFSKAQSYLLGLEERLQLLAQNPLYGRSVEQLARHLRRSEYLSHFIFYIQENKGVLVVRVLCEEMDFKQHI